MSVQCSAQSSCRWLPERHRNWILIQQIFTDFEHAFSNDHCDWKKRKAGWDQPAAKGKDHQPENDLQTEPPEEEKFQFGVKPQIQNPVFSSTDNRIKKNPNMEEMIMKGAQFQIVGNGDDPARRQYEERVKIRVELTGKYDLFFMDIKPCAWFIVRRRKIVELVVLHIGNFSPRWKIWGGKTKYGGLFLNFFHSTIFFSTYPHNLSLCTIFCTL